MLARDALDEYKRARINFNHLKGEENYICIHRLKNYYRENLSPSIIEYKIEILVAEKSRNPCINTSDSKKDTSVSDKNVNKTKESLKFHLKYNYNPILLNGRDIPIKKNNKNISKNAVKLTKDKIYYHQRGYNIISKYELKCYHIHGELDIHHKRIQNILKTVKLKHSHMINQFDTHKRLKNDDKKRRNSLLIKHLEKNFNLKENSEMNDTIIVNEHCPSITDILDKNYRELNSHKKFKKSGTIVKIFNPINYKCPLKQVKIDNPILNLFELSQDILKKIHNFQSTFFNKDYKFIFMINNNNLSGLYTVCGKNSPYLKRLLVLSKNDKSNSKINFDFINKLLYVNTKNNSLENIKSNRFTNTLETILAADAFTISIINE